MVTRQPRPTTTLSDTDDVILSKQITYLWKQCLGESDIRYYLYQSILTAQPECKWLANNLE